MLKKSLLYKLMIKRIVLLLGELMSNPTIFEIYEIEGERWANLISFGIRVKDNYKDADFDNLGLGLSFNTTEFEYVPGTFEAGSRTLEAMATADDYLNDDHADDGGLSLLLLQIAQRMRMEPMSIAPLITRQALTRKMGQRRITILTLPNYA